ncbi:hypothetical protein SEA_LITNINMCQUEEN_76 [Gordonia phage LitninMcQueen]
MSDSGNSGRLLDPGAVLEVAAEQGIVLTPWQREALEVYCAGGSVVWGRSAGKSTLLNLLTEAVRRAAEAGGSDVG